MRNNFIIIKVLLSLFFVALFIPADNLYSKSAGSGEFSFRASRDNDPVNMRLPKEKDFNDYRNRKEFDYEASNRAGSLFVRVFERVAEEIGKLLKKLFGDRITFNEERFSVGLRILFVVLSAIILFFIMKNVIGVKIFYRSKKTGSDVTMDLSEDIHAIDFESLIEKYYKLKKFREVIRLLYHKTLKELSDNDFITWEINKTNRDYIHEIHEGIMRNNFRELTRLFEYTWYGNFILNENSYIIINKKFEEFKNLIT